MSELLERVLLIQAAWARIERDTLDLCDPQAIEHATIAALAMRHTGERLAELAGLDDEPDLVLLDRCDGLGEAA